MKNQIFFYITALVVFAGSSGCQEPSASKAPLSAGDSDNVRQIIEEKNAQVEDWYRAGLVDSVATVFADDLVQLVPHQPLIEGKEEFKGFWEQMVQNGHLKFDVKTQEVKHSGDLAVERGTFKLSFTPNENSPIPPIQDEGNYVVVWERKDGHWRAVWDAPVSESQLPPPPSQNN
ncbi:YybH family protein [Pontibacter toksunensis]|uniref:YybH family protein n=1 Tax=Pontibacter toksunensis TaxID=1332631 RepID=A0ABW6BZV8_9BACT